MQDIFVKYLLPLLLYAFITGVANLLLSHKSQIEAYANSKPRLAALQKLLRAVGFDPWNFVAFVSLWAKKRLPDAQQNGAKAVAALVASGSVRPPPKSEDVQLPPFFPGGAAVLLLVCAFHAQACARSKPPCDQAKLAGVVAACTVQSQQCVNAGKSQAECETLTDCDTAIEKACGQ
jgi:hypothetical protein